MEWLFFLTFRQDSFDLMELMIRKQQFNLLLTVGLLLTLLTNSLISFAQEWDCEILPSERLTEIDPESGAEITFVTTDKSNDTNLYFHDHCWLFDGRIMLFNSDRTGRQEIFGYSEKTGELIRFNPDKESAAKFPEASKEGDRIYVVKNNSIYIWEVHYVDEPVINVHVEERKLCDYPDGADPIHGLNENSDGSLLSFGYVQDEVYHIAVVNTASGQKDVIATLDYPIQHIQFSWTRPDLLSYARSYGSDTAPLDPEEEPHARLWFVNVHTKTTVPAFYQVPGELVTHECWWVNDQITFIGGHRKEEGHVKVLDFKTNDIRIIGAGSWLDGIEARELSKVNWWHAAGSPDGRRVAADNWHGNIAIFDGKTTRMRLLTTDHRVYGSGAHPHVGWDLHGKRVEFTSNKLGNPDVCIGALPSKWTK